MEIRKIALAALIGSFALTGCVRSEETVTLAPNGDYAYDMKSDFSQMVAMLSAMKKPSSSTGSSAKPENPGEAFAASGATACAKMGKTAPKGVTVVRCDFSATGIMNVSLTGTSDSVSGAVVLKDGFGIVDVNALRKTLAFAGSGTSDASSSGGTSKSPSHPDQAKQFGMASKFVLRLPGKILFSGYGTANSETELEIDALAMGYEEPSPVYVAYATSDAPVDPSAYASYVVKPVLRRDASKPDPSRGSGTGTSGLRAPSDESGMRPPTNPGKTPLPGSVPKFAPLSNVAGVSGPYFVTKYACSKASSRFSRGVVQSPNGKLVVAYLSCEKPGSVMKAYPASTAKVRSKSKNRK